MAKVLRMTDKTMVRGPMELALAANFVGLTLSQDVVAAYERSRTAASKQDAVAAELLAALDELGREFVHVAESQPQRAAIQRALGAIAKARGEA